MSGDVVTIDIGKDFSPTPGGRYRSEGKWSGEAFRDDVLEPLLKSGKHVILMLDSAEGFMSSFLDEVFGELIRKHGPAIIDRITLQGSATRLAKAHFFIDRALVEKGAPPRFSGGSKG